MMHKTTILLAVLALTARPALEGGASLGYDRLVISPGIDFKWDASPGYDEAAGTVAGHAGRRNRADLGAGHVLSLPARTL